MTRIICLAAQIACLSFSSLGQAQVYRSDFGLGGALILPYWTTANNNDTLLVVRNEADHAAAVKFRVLDEAGAVLEVFSLYLDARSFWGAAITRIESQSVLLASNVGCVLPALTVVGGRPELALDAPRGSVEIIEMGSAGEAAEFAEGGRWADCDVLADAAESGDLFEGPGGGLDLPTQQISSSATLISVSAGGMNTIPSTAIGGFSDIAQHTEPESPLPDLAHAFDSGSDNGGVRSLVCAAGGCRIDEWEQPIEAVAAVLMVTEASVEYLVDPALAADFEWLLHRPLKRYESELDEFAIGSAAMLYVRSSDGQILGEGPPGLVCDPPPPVVSPCSGGQFPLPGNDIQRSLPFNADQADFMQIVESDILGHPAEVRPGFALGGDTWTDSPFLGGNARIRFGTAHPQLTAGDGTRYLGEPVISFAIQKFSNGTLVDDQGQNVLSNYRRTELPRQFLRLAAPD